MSLAEDYNDMKVEVKVLEEKLESYVRSAIELEDEKRRMATLRTQIEAHRLQELETETRLRDAVKRADRAEFDAQRAGEKLNALEQENARLVRDRNEMREALALANAVNGKGLSRDESSGVCSRRR